MSDLGTLRGTTSLGRGINNAGQVVGSSRLANGQERAFLYSGGMMSDLNSLIDPLSGWSLRLAYDINNSGQITGLGDIGGQSRAFLLTPLASPPVGGVPEPASWAMLIADFGLVGAMQRRRKGAWRPETAG
jgi:probable HAF family extracellular repeat protein